MKDDRIRDALQKNLSGLTVSESAHQRMYQEITEGKCKMKKKATLTLALTLALILAVTGTAVAMTIAEWTQAQLQPYENQTGWGIEERLSFLHLMQDWGVEVDEEKLAALEKDYAEKKDHLTLDDMDDLENRAGEMIYDWYAPLHDARYPLPVEQTDAYPMPDDAVLYAYLYRTQNPEATDAEINESYEAWAAALRESVTPAPTPDMTVSERILDRLWEHFDVMGMGTQETRRVESKITFDTEKNVYLVESQVERRYLTEYKQQRILNRAEDRYLDVPITDGERFFWHFYYDAEGKYLGENLDELAYDALIPYPEAYKFGEGERFRDSTRAFRNCSLAQRMEFSQTYKPIVDEWLSEHPDYAAYLAADYTRGGSTYQYTRHQYGLPPEDALQREDIEAIAKEWFLGLHPEVPEAFFDEYEDIYVYYVLSDNGPEWKVQIFCDQLLYDTDDWTETEWDYWRIKEDAAVFDAEGNLLRWGDELLPEDQYELTF